MFWAGQREAKGRVSRVPQIQRDNDTEGGGTTLCFLTLPGEKEREEEGWRDREKEGLLRETGQRDGQTHPGRRTRAFTSLGGPLQSELKSMCC